MSDFHERKKKDLSFTTYSKGLCEIVMRCIDMDMEARPSFD